MGFLDPLFFTIIVGFWGLLAASILGVSAEWLYGEVLYFVGCTYLLIRDWRKFAPAETSENALLSSGLNNGTGNSFELYRYWVVATVVLGITGMSLGLMGDGRLSSSAPRKIIDIISSLMLAGKTFEYEVVSSNIRISQRPFLLVGLITPFVVGASKGAGLPSLFWACERWLNPSSTFFTFSRLLKGKVRLLPLVIIASATILALLAALRASGASIEILIQTLSIRFARNLDIYIFLDSLPQSRISEIFIESGGWIGGLIGGLSEATNNIGSLAKAYSANIAPDATGANPRLHALVVAMNGLGNNSTLLTLSVAWAEIWFLSKLRKSQFDHGRSKAITIFNFIAWTSVINTFHADVSSLKYTIIALISGNLLLRVRTFSAKQTSIIKDACK